MNFLENEPMSKHTSFKVGGPAKYFAKVESTDEIAEALQFAKMNNLPSFILGKGTNLLVADSGYNGVIVQLGKSFSQVENLGEGKFCVGAATPLARFARTSINQGFAGIHKLAGIPGSLGGAIYMNAGAYGQEICNTCVEVTSLDFSGQIHTRTAADCKFSYRHSLFQELASTAATVSATIATACNATVAHSICSEIILSATFQLTPAASLGKTASDLENEMQECMEKRRKSQPLSLPNAGSTFKRLAAGATETSQQIAPGYYIEQAGLKGYRIGGAEVSQVHANFIVNADAATANDIKQLSEYMQKKIADKFNIHLQREIILLGEF